MPELPEVESIKKIVSPVFIGQKLIKYSINDGRTNRFNSENPKNLGILLGVSRKGKVLDFTFKDYSILFHLGMSGRIDINSKINKHTRAEFKFTKDYLVFDDIRKFGYIKFVSNQLKNNHLQMIGPDILELSIENKIENMMITLSERGLMIHNNQGNFRHKIKRKKIIDVSGAGDTVISLATLLFYLKLPEKFIGEMCNLAGGITCMKSGVNAIDLKELIKNAEINNLDIYI